MDELSVSEKRHAVLGGWPSQLSLVTMGEGPLGWAGNACGRGKAEEWPGAEACLPGGLPGRTLAHSLDETSKHSEATERKDTIRFGLI